MATSIIKKDDTGWKTLVPYICEGFEARSTNIADAHCPAYRIINGIVYLKGSVYSTTDKGSTTNADIIQNFPAEARPIGETPSSAGKRFAGSVYSIRYESGYIKVNEASPIGVQAYYAGYSLGALNPYPLR